MFYIGIDPGKTGGIAWILSGEEKAYGFSKLEGMTEHDTWQLLAKLEPGVCVMEKVHAGPSMGSSAAFKFGKSFGALHMAVICAGLQVEMVSPQKWQKEFGLLVKGRGFGQGDTEKKNRNKVKAQELFPAIKITHAIADALLIAMYCKRMAADLF